MLLQNYAPPKDVATLILAGGNGRRLGGGKPWRLLAGKPLMAHALEYAATQSETIFLSARDSTEDFSALNMALNMVYDTEALDGPMAGIIAGMEAAAAEGFDLLQIMPCDSPFLPRDLTARLRIGLESAGGAEACAVALSGGRLHPALMLIRTDQLEATQRIAKTGQKRLMALVEALAGVPCEWPFIRSTNGQIDPFFNINSETDLAEAERIWPAYKALS